MDNIGVTGQQVDDSPLQRIARWGPDKTSGPWRITLFPTNRCNLTCSICWQRGVAGLDSSKETSDERLLELVDEAAELGVHDWCIIGGGEPLIRGDLVMEMCRRIRNYGMNGVLQTNGTLLNEARIRQLLDIGWSEVNVSLDGPTLEINDEIRSKGSFAKATKNIRLLSEMKRERGCTKPVVSLYTVLTSTNFDKIDQMVELAHELGCDDGGVQLTTMVVHSEIGERFQLSEKHKAALPEHVEKAIECAAKYEQPHNFVLYLKEEVVADPNAMRDARDTESYDGIAGALCVEPWVSIAITATGELGPCCAFFDPTAENIQTTSLRDAWLGPYMQKVRGQMMVHQPPEYCSRCPSIIFSRSEDLRNDLVCLRYREYWQQLSKLGKVAYLSRKAYTSLRQNGVVSAVRRGLEWGKIYLSR